MRITGQIWSEKIVSIATIINDVTMPITTNIVGDVCLPTSINVGFMVSSRLFNQSRTHRSTLVHNA